MITIPASTATPEIHRNIFLRAAILSIIWLILPASSSKVFSGTLAS